MKKFGSAPFLECSSKGDSRFSAFKAKVYGKTIEELYQAFKVFEDGATGLHWKQAKGKKPINAENARKYYSMLWREWFRLNPAALEYIRQYNGFSDVFGQEGHACQAEEIYNILVENH